jgi:hypothetical protein
VAISVGAINDAPVNTVPAGQATNEETALVFSSANANAISVADVDAATGPVQITLGVTNGTLTLSGTTGLSFTTGTGSGDATMVFTGTLADVNAALDGLSYAPTANYAGPATLTLTTDDQGNTGAGGALSASSSVAITVNAINDAPVNTVPGPQGTNEDTALVFSGANAISVADVDAAAGPLQITLGVTNGTLTLSGTTGLSFTTGTGTGNATMVFTGTLADVNAALDGLSYAPTANYAGPATLTLTTNDQGNTGAGGPLATPSAVAITVNAVNDAPASTVPGLQVTAANTPLVFRSADGNAISIADVDAGTSPVQITLGVTNGTLTLSTTAGLTFTTGTGTSDATMVFTGTLANVNAALDGLRFAPTTNYSGPAIVTVAVDDQGNTGGAPRVAFGTVPLTVQPAPTGLTGGEIDVLPFVPLVPPAHDAAAIPLDPRSLGSIAPPLVVAARQEVLGSDRRIVVPFADLGGSEGRLVRLQWTETDELRTSDHHRSGLLSRGISGNLQMWKALDRLHDELRRATEQATRHGDLVASTSEGVALLFSVSLLTALLRGGSLLAIAMSSLPYWREVDALTVLALSEEERRKRDEELRAAKQAEDRDEGKLGRLFDDDRDDDDPAHPAATKDLSA